MNSKEVDSLTN